MDNINKQKKKCYKYALVFFSLLAMLAHSKKKMSQELAFQDST